MELRRGKARLLGSEEETPNFKLQRNFKHHRISPLPNFVAYATKFGKGGWLGIWSFSLPSAEPQQLLFTDDLHTEFLRLVELGAGILAGHDVIRLLADTAADLSP